MEVYASLQFRLEDLLYQSFATLQQDAFDPRDLCLYEESSYQQLDFPYSRFDAERLMHWVRGEWLGTEKPVWLAALPTFRYFPSPRQQRFCQVTSNGLAAGFSYHDASLRAILELAERDAVMVTWFAPVCHKENCCSTGP